MTRLSSSVALPADIPLTFVEEMSSLSWRDYFFCFIVVNRRIAPAIASIFSNNAIPRAGIELIWRARTIPMLERRWPHRTVGWPFVSLWTSSDLLNANSNKGSATTQLQLIRLRPRRRSWPLKQRGCGFRETTSPGIAFIWLLSIDIQCLSRNCLCNHKLQMIFFVFFSLLIVIFVKLISCWCRYTS